MNIVTLIGNVCRDFELRQTTSGMSVASNSLAVKRDRKEADGTYATDFFDITLFGAQADYAIKWLRKGDKVCVSGSVHIRDFVSRNGTKGRAVEVTVNSVENLTPKEAGESQPEVEENQVEENQVDVVDEDDDLPF